MYEGLSDEELASMARSGSSSALGELGRRYHARLVRHLRGRMRCLQDAEDLAQETFLKASRNLHRYDAARPFEAWVLTIATRLAISDGRTRRESAGLDEIVVVGGADPQSVAARNEAAANLWAAARRELSERQYRAVYLRYDCDKSVAEIAREMKLTQVHVKVLLHRARKRLMKCQSLQDEV